MEDGEQESLLTGLRGDSRILVATTIATLVIATSSVIIWRSQNRGPGANSIRRARLDPDPGCTATASPGENHHLDIQIPAKKASSECSVDVVLDDLLTSELSSKDAKNSRSKDRRRRRKGPLKEILKGAQKDKVFTKTGGTDPSDSTTTSAVPHLVEFELSERSRDTSVATSSRSVSCSTSSTHRSNFTDHTRGLGEDSKSDYDANDDDSFHPVKPAYTLIGQESIPTSHDPLQAQSQSETAAVDRSSSSHLYPNVESTSHNNENETSNLLKNSPSRSSSPASLSSSSLMDTLSTPPSEPVTTTNIVTNTTPSSSLPPINTVPTPFPTENHLHPSQSLPSYMYPNSSLRMSQKAPSPWDWEGHAVSASTGTNEAAAGYRKPPRFRPKSRMSSLSASIPPAPLPGSISMPYAIPFTSTSSSSYTSSSADSPSLQPAPMCQASSSTNAINDPSLQFTFATLNASSDPSAGPSSSPDPSQHLFVNAHVNSEGSSPRRAATPRHTRTPSIQSQPGSGRNTPPQSLSMQTQITSLRGALEAARMREEKARTELEKYTKECEMMRWEGAAWRRREVEMQTQIHHLMHQLQGYAALFTSMSQTQSVAHTPLTPHFHGGNSGPNGMTMPSQQHYPNSGAPMSLPQSPQSHFQMLSPNPMLLPASISNSNSSSSFLAYSPQLNMHSQVPAQSNLISTLFPLASSINSSGRSSVSSSVGSMSPDPGSSPSPASMMFDRGRRKTRTRTQTATTRMGGMDEHWQGEGDGGDGWIEVGDAGDGQEDRKGRGVARDEPVNELLADAILKRPDSIRAGSHREQERKGEDGKETDGQTVFTFASISDLGLADRSALEKAQTGEGSDTGREVVVLNEDGPGEGGERGDIWNPQGISVQHNKDVVLPVGVGIRTTAG